MKIPEGIVLSGISRVTGRAQMIAAKGTRYWHQSQWMIRWTPKFNVAGRHQVNPVKPMMMEVEKSEGKGRKEEWKRLWELQQTRLARGVMDMRNFELTCLLKLPPSSSPSSLLITIFATHHHLRYSYHLRYSLHSSPDWVDLVSPSKVELWRSSYRSWLWCQWRVPLTAIIWARPVTLEMG
jgi:hypothetical protein